MTVVISPSLVLSADVVGSEVNADNPIIGYENLVTVSNITTDTADPDFPAVNLANAATYLRWQGAGGSPLGDEHVTIILDTAEHVDYVGIARHNLGTGLIPVSVEGMTELGDPWVELTTDVILPDDSPAIFRFTPQALYAIRIRLQSNAIDPTIAVVYVGKLLILQRRIYVGHTPITYGRQTRVVNARSESGNFLGRIITGEGRATGVNLSNITPAWYRQYMEPFVIAAQEIPFFFNWRPGDYPYESGFVWLTEDVTPVNQRTNGMMQFAMKMNGIA